MNAFKDRAIMYSLKEKGYDIIELISLEDDFFTNPVFISKFRVNDGCLYFSTSPYNIEEVSVVSDIARKVDYHLELLPNVDSDLPTFSDFIKFQVLNRLAFENKSTNIYNTYKKEEIDKFTLELANIYKNISSFVSDFDCIDLKFDFNEAYYEWFCKEGSITLTWKQRL